MKKRLLAVAMSGVMAMSLAACGGSNEAAATTAAPAATEAPAGDATEAAETKAAETEAPAAEAVDLDVAVFYYTYSDTYISSVRTALDAALTDAGIKR